MSHLSEESYYSGSEEEEDGSGSEGEEAEWTADHLKLLYLISQYAKAAREEGDKEGWIRKNQLIVLMYECIVRGVFDYDYAPASAMVHGKRIYMNVTQEGRDHLEDLVEAKYVRALRTITQDKQPVVASTRSLPLWMCGMKGGAVPKVIST